MDGVRREQQPRHQGREGSNQQAAGEVREEGGGGRVAEHVAQVVAPGVEPAQVVVEAEGEDAEGPVGLVGARVDQRGSPEVIVQQVGDGRVWQQVGVLHDGTAATDTIAKISQFISGQHVALLSGTV